MKKDSSKTRDKTLISWKSLVFMAFATLWGFGNVTNGYFYFDGPKVIFSWILMFALYFIPYAMIVGELGSKFKDEGGGVTSWTKVPMDQNLHIMQDGPIGQCILPI